MTQRIRMTLFEPVQAHKVLTQQIWPLVKASIMAGHRMVVEVKPETRSLAQNARLWAMLGDVSKQVNWHGRKLSPTAWKHVLPQHSQNKTWLLELMAGLSCWEKKPAR